MFNKSQFCGIVVGALLLSACGPQPPKGEQKSKNAQSAPTRKYRAVTGAETPLQLEFTITGEPNSPVISGDTNLPDGTHLAAQLIRENLVMSDDADIVIANGSFKTPALHVEGRPLLPGKYTLEISSPLEAVQPDPVRAAVGREYENLTGDGFEDGQFGRMIAIRQPYVVPGSRDVAGEKSIAQERRQKVHEFYRRSCAETEYNAGRPTRTPIALARIEECVRRFEKGS